METERSVSKQKTQIRKPLYFHPRKDGDYSGFVFSEKWQQTEFLQFGSRFRGKYAGVRRGAGLRGDLKMQSILKH